MNFEQEKHAAAMRLRSVDRRLRILTKKSFPSVDERKKAVAAFLEQVRKDKRTKRGLFN